MILGHIAFVALVLMGLLATLLVVLRMVRLCNSGLAPYEEAASIGWKAFGIHTILWVVLYWLVN